MNSVLLYMSVGYIIDHKYCSLSDIYAFIFYTFYHFFHIFPDVSFFNISVSSLVRP